jgi:hypothetical protein
MSLALSLLLLLFPMFPVTRHLTSAFQSRDERINRLIREFYPERYTYIRAERAKKKLLNIASESSESRSDVISALIATLEQPDLPAFPDHAHVWMYVCAVLGELRATEAIDMLINHPSDSQGLSGHSLSLRPSLKALVSISEQAIPRLEEALLDQGNSNLCREQAIDALIRMDGGQARKALENALGQEMNEHIRNRIESALKH